MRKKRHKTEEIIRIIRKVDGGQSVEDICREESISVQTFYRWRRKYGRMEMADAKRFKELEKENTELKKMLADEMLKSRVLEASLKKVVSASAKKRLVLSAVESGLCSVRRACRYLDLSRSSWHYRERGGAKKKDLTQAYH